MSADYFALLIFTYLSSYRMLILCAFSSAQVYFPCVPALFLSGYIGFTGNKSGDGIVLPGVTKS